MAPLQSGFAVITPASRGIGFALAHQLLANTSIPLIATARKNCDQVRHDLLDKVKDNAPNAKERLQVLDVDVTDESTVSAMASTIRQFYPRAFLRLAITVPGVLHVEKSPMQIDAETALHSFKVNALGPMLVMKHLSPFLPNRSSPPFQDDQETCRSAECQWNLPTSHAIYAMMAARVGSISDNASGGWYSYRASKASVFQLAKTFDLYLQIRSQERAMAIALHPGTVQTDFTMDYRNGRKMLQPEDAATKLLQVLCTMKTGVDEGRGRCWDWRGNEVLP
ncbi:hypothetical protein P175DRAFT_0517475 [Aspergillus ochraceoroseus IBT 24754]|uniref:Short-chain dehydrogenase n=1 Tax=Aspergillus ochraceoroseus IBT 24754 TaxID=1392256 RepID=A0A2T5LSA8_9EURO|nr:uncharacterized protein P175DRAFT_0517475 [Aspergillus ochraceoroseus IBT 24754]PTU19161.1 hypothetical protein P175DRAFT_0517475 [Aspergillus ochraceoroseus IBT 24754]